MSGFLSIRSTGDVIEVKLRDSSFEPYFKGTAKLNSPKEMQTLFRRLKTKGVNISTGWFD